ncbi:glyoxalase [Amycolatopsis antarctica]|uniref:Glyoxalase n=2 Tax=Amycolatopsis antarctica TaxID=1854586 RepID=A0A263CYV3_9PSEU|nr:glyoxalase [Amycolatopsis antarctica]
MGAKQLKVGLRVGDMDRSCTLYRKVGFKEIPEEQQPGMRYLTYGHTWLMLSGRFDHGYHHDERGNLTRQGPLGYGFVLVVPTTDIDAMRELWRREELPVTLEPEDTGWARIFYGLDPDGYEVMFEQFH